MGVAPGGISFLDTFRHVGEDAESDAGRTFSFAVLLSGVHVEGDDVAGLKGEIPDGDRSVLGVGGFVDASHAVEDLGVVVELVDGVLGDRKPESWRLGGCVEEDEARRAISLGCRLRSLAIGYFRP